MNIKIPQYINQCDFYTNKPFTVFEIKQFLDEDFFNNLNEEFPLCDKFLKISDKGKKMSLDNTEKNFFRFLDTSKSWKSFYNFINQKECIESLINLVSKDILNIEERKNIKNIKFFKNYSYKNFLSRIINKIYKIKYSTVRLGFQFSIIKKDCFIPPHCDVSNKLLSLMLYFPLKNQSEKMKKFGTNFYALKDNYQANLDTWDSKLTDRKFSDLFYNNYKVFYSSLFEKNKLVGFIKKNNSWHDVDVISDDIERKSVNINLYLI